MSYATVTTVLGQMKIRGKTAAEIFESVRAQISAGASATDEVLPPVRILAAELKVNRNTVAAAYRKLALAGIVETGGRRGTVIRKQRATPLDHEGLGSDSRLFDLASGNPNPDWCKRRLKSAAGGGRKTRHPYPRCIPTRSGCQFPFHLMFR